MKKILLGFALLTFAVATQAQDGFSKGNIFVSGGIGISSTNEKNSDTKTSDFAVTPSLGYMVSDNLAVGIGLGIGSSKTTVAGTTESEASAMNVGGFARYYFAPKSNFTMFGHLGVNYNSENDKTNEVKTTGMDIFVAPGFNYWVSKRLALEAVIGKIGYRSSKTDIDGDDGSTGFGLGIDLSSVSFGMVFKLK